MHSNSAFGTTELHSYIIYFFSKPGNECSIVRNIFIIENRFTPYTGVGDAQETHLQTQPSSHLEKREEQTPKTQQPHTPIFLPWTLDICEGKESGEQKLRARAVFILHLSGMALTV